MKKRKPSEVTVEEFFNLCLDAETIREESYDGEKYTKKYYDIAEEVCIKNKLTNDFIGPISGIIFALWNDVQVWSKVLGIKHEAIGNKDK